jgi:lipid-A-disaccharide synthase
MAGFVDHVLALLPFEPDVHRRLGGPNCSYVGHPLIERLKLLRPEKGERPRIDTVERPTVVVLPGSRRSEVKRLLKPFGEAIDRLDELAGPLDVIVPAVPHLVETIHAEVATWPVRPRIVEGEKAKFEAFRRAHAALAASGTVTLELALAGVPMVVAYRVDPMAKPVVWLIRASWQAPTRSMVLPNLILDANVIPEFVGSDSDPDTLARALSPLLDDTPERRHQIAAFERLDALMSLDRTTPSQRAADIVLETVRSRRLHAALGRS